MIDKQFEKEEFKKSVKENVKFLYRKTLEEATQEQIFQAVSYTVKDVIIDNWLKSQKAYEKQDPKIVYYMSMEFLMGRALGNNLINLGAYGEVKEALEELGLDINCIEDQEPDPALGNGGLGRLAACFLDSLATLNYCAYGCGIRYRYGMFKQEIRDGYQVEVPDAWLEEGYPFELRRPEYAKEVHFGGYVRVEYDQATGQNKFIHEGYQAVKAIPYDMPIVGYENNIVNTLRIWDAAAIEEFGFDSFDKGDYKKAVEQENLAKDIVNVLYPNDNKMSGKELRLKQQYFFVSASIQAAIAKYKKTHDDIKKLHEKVVFQMNDTHPTMAVAELMRILMDQEGLGWDDAWAVTSKCVAYTNHTVMKEALECWSEDLYKRLLPRIYSITKEIDNRFRAYVWGATGDADKVERMAIVSGGVVRMANLCVAGSHSVNGVSALHSEILKDTVFNDFYTITPEKFTNVTNGIAFRRWICQSNPKLTSFITELIGDGFITKSDELLKLREFKDDKQVLDRLAAIKLANKERFADIVKKRNGIELDPTSIFDVQVKRLHEYKRQQLNVLNIIAEYQMLKANPNMEFQPRTYIFASKAAPGYFMAKKIIELIDALSKVVNNDPDIKGRIKVVFMEDYNVSLAEKLMPAADISEQISLASKEASGTSNMKFMLNGAVTLGTEDGANVEIHELVGDDNIYIFGEKSDTVIEHYAKADYSAEKIYDEDPEIAKLVDFIIDKKMFAVGNKKSLIRLYMEIVTKDWFMTLLDIKDYIRVKEQVFKDYEDRAAWSRKMIKNIAMAGFFSSDRTIAQYNDDIWHLD